MRKPTYDMREAGRIYALIAYGPPAISINWSMIAPNYHYNIKDKLKEAGYTAKKENFGGYTKYEKEIRKVI